MRDLRTERDYLDEEAMAYFKPLYGSPELYE